MNPAADVMKPPPLDVTVVVAALREKDATLDANETNDVPADCPLKVHPVMVQTMEVTGPAT